MSDPHPRPDHRRRTKDVDPGDPFRPAVFWTRNGRAMDAQTGHRARTPARKPPNCRRSPLSDSNRRLLPYHGRLTGSRASTDARNRARNPCKLLQSRGYGRGRRNTVDVDLVDAEWTRSRCLFVPESLAGNARTAQRLIRASEALLAAVPGLCCFWSNRPADRAGQPRPPGVV